MLTVVENPFLNFLASNRGVANILRAKCVVTGDSMVGKTSIVQSFVSEIHNFQRNYSMTNGVDVRSKKVSVPDTDDVVELYIYDSSGKEIYFNTISPMLENPSLIFVVYDVTQEKSLKNCSHWLDILRKSSPVGIPGVLVGNKVDLTKRRVIASEDAAEFARHNDLAYFECSAMENEGIEEPFFYLVNEYHKLYLEKTELFKTLN